MQVVNTLDHSAIAVDAAWDVEGGEWFEDIIKRITLVDQRLSNSWYLFLGFASASSICWLVMASTASVDEPPAC